MRRPLATAALVGGSTLVGIVLWVAAFELGLRLMTSPDNPPGMSRKHPTRRYQLLPGFSGFSYDAPIEFDSRGVRGVERAIDLSADTLRVLVLGDSMTYGVGVSVGHAFPAVLERRLQASRAEPVQVFNLGVPGYNTVDELIYLQEAAPTYRPRLVILEFTYGNDARLERRPRPQVGWRSAAWWQALREIPPASYAFKWLWIRFQDISYRIDTREQPSDPLERFRAERRQLERAYAEDAPGWIAAQEALAEMARFSDERGIGLLVGIFANDFHLEPHFRDVVAPHTARVRDTMHALGIRHVVVLDDVYASYGGREELLWVRPPVDKHWSALAHELVADLLWRYLEGSPELTAMRSNPEG